MKMHILIFILCVTLTQSARILVVVPTPSVSHQMVFYPLVKELARRGHDVVYITTDPIYPKGLSPNNLTEIDLHDVSYDFMKPQLLRRDVTSGSETDLKNQISVIFRNLAKVFEIQMNTDEVQHLLMSNTHFDLLIIEACVKSALSLAHLYNAPVILMSSFGSMQDQFDIMGAPKHPKLLYPYIMHQKLVNLSIWDKIKVLYDVYAIEIFFADLREEEDAIVKKLFGPDTPSLHELGKRVHMLFLNIYPLWEMNRPVPPGVVFIGGIHKKPEKELPHNLKKFLDSSKKGVIYISFGTNVDPALLPPEKIQILVNVLFQLPYDVLWKWDKGELPGRTENIRLAKWFPQIDIFRHPKVKLFITQGGLQSTDEAIGAGIPMLGIPMLGDQWFNVEMYKLHKIGLGLSLSTITEDTFKEAVQTLIEDPSYRHNVISLRNKIHDQPQNALDRAVWWTEHVIRHGGASHLRAPAANLSWSEYLDIELLSVLLLALIIVIVVVCSLLYMLVKFIKSYFRYKLKTN